MCGMLLTRGGEGCVALYLQTLKESHFMIFAFMETYAHITAIKHLNITEMVTL